MANIVTLPSADVGGIPTVAPGPAQELRREDYQRINATPQDFGAQVGGAEEKFGAGVLKLGDFFDQAAASQAYTSFQTGVNNLMYGDPDKLGPDGKPDPGFMGLTGEDAMNARPGVQKQIEQLLQQTKGGLSTLRSQLDFEQASRRLQQGKYDEMGRHYENQSNVWGLSVANGALVQNERQAANSYNDDPQFNHLVEDSRHAAVQGAQHSGKDPTAALAEADSRMVAARIQGAIAQNDYPAANKIFNTYGDRLDANTRMGFAAHLRTQNTAADGQAILGWAKGDAAMPAGGAAAGPSEPIVAPPQYAPLIKQAADQHGVPEELLTRVLSAESGFNPTAKGPPIAKLGGVSAQGIAQFIPATAAKYNLDPNNPTQAIPGAARYLADLKAETGTWNGAVAKYLGTDPHNDAQYTKNGVPQLVDALDRGQPTALYAPGALASPASGSPTEFAHASGDSIAVQQIHHRPALGSEADFKTGADLPGTARVGAGGPEILRRINDEVAANPKAFAGVNFLSSGASNDPAHAGFVGDQIDALKKGGATAVVVPGVGPGIPNAAAVNASLKSVVEEHGGVFFQPQVKWQADGIHPAEVDKVRDQGLAALAAKGAGAPPDQMQGQPAPTAGMRPAAAAPTMPPGTPAPGVAEVAQQQAAEIQSYAHTLDRIDQRRAAGVDSAQALDHAASQAQLEHNRHEAVLAGQMKALTEARNAGIDGYVKELRPDQPIPPDIYDRISADVRLDGESRKNLYALAQAHEKKSVAGDLISYGPKFYEAYSRLSLPDTDNQRLRDISQLLPMAAPKDDGSQDITLAGVGKLAQTMEELKKRDPVLAEKKKELLNLIMPMDRNAEEYSLPQRQQRYGLNFDIDQQIEQAARDKKNPYNLFNPTSPDFLGKHYQEQIDANALRQKIEGDAALKTEAGIVAAAKAGTITRAQAAERLKTIGIPFVDPPAGTPAQPQAPMP